MKLYEIRYVDVNDRTKREWYGTQVELKQNMKALKAEGFVPKPYETDVPINKARLLQFLNQNCTIIQEDE